MELVSTGRIGRLEMSKARILIAMAATGLVVAVSAPAAGAAGFGIECEGGGTRCAFDSAMLGEEKSVVIINQAVVAQKLTRLIEASKEGGTEYLEVNANERTTCVNKNYGAGETCKIKVKYYKAVGLTFPEIILTVEPAGCPNMTKLIV
jgi:hypothetical protein